MGKKKVNGDEAKTEGMRMEKRKVGALKIWPNNPQKMDAFRMEELKKSLTTYGYIDPLIVNLVDEVIGGNHRLMALKEVYGPDREIDVVVVDMARPLQVKLNIALNQIHGDFDIGILKGILDTLITDGDDLSNLGFKPEELEAIGADLSGVMGGLGGGPVDERPEIEFTEELLEAHNYVVFAFDNILDWQSASSSLGIKTVKELDDKPGKYERRGIGRVLKGKVLLDLLTREG